MIHGCRFTGDDDSALKIKRIDEGGIDGDLCCVVSTGAWEP